MCICRMLLSGSVSRPRLPAGIIDIERIRLRLLILALARLTHLTPILRPLAIYPSGVGAYD